MIGNLRIINYGDIMCVDILLIEGNRIKIDEISLIGESDLMKKEANKKCLKSKKINDINKIPSSIIVSGMQCIEGNGKGIVIIVGEYSQKVLIKYKKNLFLI